MQELENRLRQEEDEMREMLKEKNWYANYVKKIAEERDKTAQALEHILKQVED